MIIRIMEFSITHCPARNFPRQVKQAIIYIIKITNIPENENY